MPEIEEELVDPAHLQQMLGWDTDRKWTNNVQVFLNPDHVLFVFREIVEVEGIKQDGTTEKGNLAKNVTSLIMPVKVAQSFAQIMATLFKDADTKPE